MRDLGFEPVETGDYYFLSYNSQDAGRIAPLFKALSESGVPIWYDKGIRYDSSQWSAEIARHIKGCKAMLFAQTSKLIQRENGYAKLEYDIAQNFGKEIYVLAFDSVDVRSAAEENIFFVERLNAKQQIQITGNINRDAEEVCRILKITYTLTPPPSHRIILPAAIAAGIAVLIALLLIIRPVPPFPPDPTPAPTEEPTPVPDPWTCKWCESMNGYENNLCWKCKMPRDTEPTPTETPTPTPTSTPTETPEPTPTSTPTETPEPTPKPTPEINWDSVTITDVSEMAFATATAMPCATPSATPVPAPTPSPTPEPTPTPTPTPEPTPELTEEPASRVILAAAIRGISFREEPKLNGKLICSISTGEQVEVLDYSGAWWKVLYNDQVGYVHSDNLKLIQSPTPEKSSSTESVKAGDHITFGAYPQTASGNDSTPIEWRILDVQDGKAFVISEYELDVKPYNASYTSTKWETCSLRKWLNGNFLSKAFSSEEQNAICTTKVDNSKIEHNGEYKKTFSNYTDTQDKIFLLSYAEAKRYFGAAEESSGNAESRAKPTAYAITQEAYPDNENLSVSWWLRSPGPEKFFASCVSPDGSLSYDSVSSELCAVRPSLWLNLSAAIKDDTGN